MNETEFSAFLTENKVPTVARFTGARRKAEAYLAAFEALRRWVNSAPEANVVVTATENGQRKQIENPLRSEAINSKIAAVLAFPASL